MTKQDMIDLAILRSKKDKPSDYYKYERWDFTDLDNYDRVDYEINEKEFDHVGS